MEKVKKYIVTNLDNFVLILISVLILNLLFYIFVGSRAIINSDSTFIVDYSIEQIETKSIFPSSWVNTNDFWIYSLIPIITPLIKMGVSLFTSRQIAVFIQTICFFALVYDFYKKVFNDKKGLIIMLLILLSGVSGQFMYEMYGDATYGTIVFYMLLELWLFIKYVKSDYKKKKYIISFGVILSLLSACSLRFPIYIGAPLICSLLYFCYEDGKINKKYVKAFGIICISILIGFLINKYMVNNLTFINNYDESNMIDNEDFFSYNLTKTMYDYFFVCGATGKNIYSLTLHLNNDFITSTSSPLVVLNFIKYIYAIVTFLIPFILLKKIKEMNKEEKVLLIYVSSFTFMMIFFLVIGDLAWWHRYVFTIIFCLNLLYPMFYKYCFEKKKKDRVIFKIALSMFVISSLVFSISSYINVSKNHIRRNDYQYLSQELLNRGFTFGYTLDKLESNLYRTITNGKLQVVRLTNDAKSIKYWLTSIRWYKPDYYQGKTFLVRTYKEDPVDLELKAVDKYRIGDFEVFEFESNEVVINYLLTNT